MNRPTLNLWPWAFVLCVLTGYAAMAHLDGQPTDYEIAASQDRRMWAQAVQFCHRAFGPQTAPEYDDRDQLICVGKRGQRMAAVRATPDAPNATAVKVASK